MRAVRIALVLATACWLSLVSGCERQDAQAEGRAGTRSKKARAARVVTAEFPAPALEEPYPDLTGMDQEGKPFRLSSHRGSVILVELIGMPCRGCIAFCGGHEVGPFRGKKPQDDLPSLNVLYTRFAGGGTFATSGVVYVQVLCFDMKTGTPTERDVKEWAKHFHVDRAKNHFVIAGSPQLFGAGTRDMIPGFHLVDRELRLVGDACGHTPKHDPYRELLPMIPKLLGNR